MFSNKIYRKAGNEDRNMLPFFQPKMQVSSPGDRYEKEADAVAESVVNDQHHTNNHFEHTPISSGSTMPKTTRSFFEKKLGHDFSNVKIHTDTVAAKSAQSINALAYTTGNHIVFSQNQYQPETTSGKKLLAHELTHVVQQSNGMSTNTLQRTPDFKCRKDIPDLEDPMLLGKTFVKKVEDIELPDLMQPRIIKNATNGTNFYLYNIHNNAGCDALRPLIEGSQGYMIREGLFYDQVWAKQPNTPSDLFFWGWVDKKYLNKLPPPSPPPENKKKKDPDPDPKPEKEKGWNECDDPLFCKPYTDPVESEMALKEAKSNFSTVVEPLISADAASLWKKYLSGAETPAPIVFKSQSEIAQNFAGCYVNDDMIDTLIAHIKEKAQEQCIKVFPNKTSSFRVSLLADSMHLNPVLEYNSLARCADASLTAGGMGGNDKRYIDGSIHIEPGEMNTYTGERSYTVTAGLEIHVSDTVDFCPGQCGAPIEQFITLPMSRLEATGIISDVPFEVYYDVSKSFSVTGADMGICNDFLSED